MTKKPAPRHVPRRGWFLPSISGICTSIKIISTHHILAGHVTPANSLYQKKVS